MGDIFWEDFLGGFFWEDFLGGFFWEEFFGGNDLVEINMELMLLQYFRVILSQCTGRKERRKEEIRSLEVRGKLIAIKSVNKFL